MGVDLRMGGMALTMLFWLRPTAHAIDPAHPNSQCALTRSDVHDESCCHLMQEAGPCLR